MKYKYIDDYNKLTSKQTSELLKWWKEAKILIEKLDRNKKIHGVK